MAVYKVPQDVEADDKLIGPFSFRQFIYLIIVAVCIALAWGLSRANALLAVLPLPVIIVFLALALPLRKDQPMETYLSAVVSFYFLKPRKRLWEPDGVDSFVTVIPPKNSDRILTKNLDDMEANKRISYLAQLVDTHGWAIREEGSASGTSMHRDLYNESRSTEDMFDATTESAVAMNKRLASQANERREAAKVTMQKASVVKEKKADGSTEYVDKTPAKEAVEPLRKNSMSDKEIGNKDTSTSNSKNDTSKPAVHKDTTETNTATKSAITTSVTNPGTDTIGLTRQQAEELSQNKDLTVKTLAEQANRIAKKNKEALLEGEEVMISLR